MESREENERNACDVDDIDLVGPARNWGRAALEKLILRHHAWIDNIAVRMVSKQHDAEVWRSRYWQLRTHHRPLAGPDVRRDD